MTCLHDRCGLCNSSLSGLAVASLGGGRGTACHRDSIDRCFASVVRVTAPAHAVRSVALDLASQMLESPEDLVVRCRQLLRLLRTLALDVDRAELRIFRAVDSEADSWPVEVDAERLDPVYHRRCLAETQDYSRTVWPEVRIGCCAVQALLATPN